MENGSRQFRLFVLCTLVGVAAVGLIALYQLCYRSPRIAFLTPAQQAEWIVYPKPPEAQTHYSVDMETVFRRSFQLERQPQSATLSLRALKQCAIAINGSPVAFNAPANWKDTAVLDVSKFLKPGSNQLSFAVTNSGGPPVLWFTLKVDTLVLNSDEQCEASFVGAAWRKVRSATQPMAIEKDNVLYHAETPIVSLSKRIPTLLLFGLISAALIFAGSRIVAKFQTWRDSPQANVSDKFAFWVLSITALAWVAMFIHNLPLLPNKIGFDAEAHMEYIQYIRTHHALPLATDGWETCQPPLYYLVAALLTMPLGINAYGTASIQLFRFFGLLIGVAHFAFIFLSARLLFPGRIGKQLICLAVAACVPELLYISHYVTNESLAATCVAGAIYFCLRIIVQNQASWRLAALSGLMIGAGLLSKVTALLALPFLAASIALWLFLNHRGNVRLWCSLLGAFFLAAFGVSAWHYIRVWIHYGTPIVHDWDAVSGYAWWTDEGFHSPGYFLRFGQSLMHPTYSVLNSFGDGVYSTLWGDALLGGKVNGPPWNVDLMSAGYLLALAPTLLILAGFVSQAIAFLRRPDATGFLLLGVACVIPAALVYMNLKLPFYCNVKAFYALIVLLPACAFAASGWELLTRRLRIAQFALGTLLGIWAINAFFTFWIPTSAISTDVTRGLYFSDEGRFSDAISLFSAALKADPEQFDARRGLLIAQAKTGQLAESFAEAKRLADAHPGDARYQLLLSSLSAASHDLESALQYARKAVEFAPNLAEARRYECKCLAILGRTSEIIPAAREAIALIPFDPELHFQLGSALSKEGRLDAVDQLRVTCLLQTNWPAAQDALGMALLATHEPRGAIDCFNRALKLFPDEAGYHAHLGAAFEQSGNTSEAISSYRKALALNPKFQPAIEGLARLGADQSAERNQK